MGFFCRYRVGYRVFVDIDQHGSGRGVVTAAPPASPFVQIRVKLNGRKALLELPAEEGLGGGVWLTLPANAPDRRMAITKLSISGIWEMSEQEWLACDDPRLMIAHFKLQNEERRLRLIVCAHIRLTGKIWQTPPTLEMMNALELFADGATTLEEMTPFQRPANLTNTRFDLWDITSYSAYEAAEHIVFGDYYLDHHGEFITQSNVSASGKAAKERFARQRLRLIRDIFGNPFRPREIDPSWLTPDVRGLAEGIYEDYAFNRMPILADALEDANCDDEEILSHCREPAPHYRGCWVVDQLLGKAPTGRSGGMAG